MGREREAAAPTVVTRWRQGHTAWSRQGQGRELECWIPFTKGGVATVVEKGVGQSKQAQRSGVRAEVRLPHLQESLGPDSEMQLQTLALLLVQGPELTAQPQTLSLRAFLGRKKLEPGVLPL